MIIDEPGVLPKSEIHIFDPLSVGAQSLIHIPFWGDYHCRVPYTIDRDRYDAFLLFSIHSGQLELTYNGYTTVLTEGSVKIIDCHLPQFYKALGDLHFDWIHFRGGSSQALYTYLAEHSVTGFSAKESPELINEMVRLKQQILQTPDDVFKINLNMTRLLTGMIESIAGASDLENSFITQSHIYMTEHFREHLQLEDIARTFNVSTCHFARQFRLQYKVSPHDYLVSLRIGEARRQLLMTGRSVEAIGVDCGFNSTSHFIRAFSQRTGATPAQYRKLKF